MRRVALATVAALALAAAPAHARDRWDTQVLALVPTPGFPAHAYVAPNGRVYEGTYTNPNGDTVPSRVFEYEENGTFLRSWTVRGQRLERRRVVERHAVRRRGLARDAAHRQGVRPVGRHRDVQHLVAQAEHVDRVRPERRLTDDLVGEHEDPGVVVAGAELAGRADHAVAEVSVGLPGGDGEPARQHGAEDMRDMVEGDVRFARPFGTEL